MFRDMNCVANSSSLQCHCFKFQRATWAAGVILRSFLGGVQILTHTVLNTGQGRNPCFNDLTTILLLTDGTELTSLVCHCLCSD